MKIIFPDDFLNKFSSQKEINSFIKIRNPFSINEVVEGSNAFNSGIKKGDKIISIDNEEIIDMFEFHEKIKIKDYNKINLEVKKYVKFKTITSLSPCRS